MSSLVLNILSVPSPDAVQILVFQACLMLLCPHFGAFDFLYMTKFPVAEYDEGYLVPKRCRVVQLI